MPRSTRLPDGVRKSTVRSSGTAVSAARHAAAADRVKAAAMRSLAARSAAVAHYTSDTRTIRRSAPELKNVDIVLDGAISYGQAGEPDTQVYCSIAQGVGSFQRIGREVTLKSIQIRASIHANTASTMADVRLVLVYDKQANGTDLSFTSVFDTQTVESFPKLENSKRFVILWDKNMTILSNTTTPVNDNVLRTIDFYKKVNLKQLYSGTGSSYTDLQTGSLYLMAICDVPVGAGTVQPSWTGMMRVRYVDN